MVLKVGPTRKTAKPRSDSLRAMCLLCQYDRRATDRVMLPPVFDQRNHCTGRLFELPGKFLWNVV
jgi:hypothetical protein